jgi:hypothetical protein
MALVAATFPIPPGNLEAWHLFQAELSGARQAEFAASRKRLGVRERTFHQPTPMGDFVVVTLEGDDLATVYPRMLASTDAFDRWFVGRVEAIHGIDMAVVAAAPLPALIADSGA